MSVIQPEDSASAPCSQSAFGDALTGLVLPVQRIILQLRAAAGGQSEHRWEDLNAEGIGNIVDKELLIGCGWGRQCHATSDITRCATLPASGVRTGVRIRLGGRAWRRLSADSGLGQDGVVQ